MPSRWKVLSGEFRRPHDGCTLMHGLKCGSCRFWQRTDSPPGSNMLRAEIQRALRRAPRQLRRLARLANSPGSNHSAAQVGESNSRSNVFQIRRTTACVYSRWKVLSGEFRRRPTEFVIKLRNPDRVGRRGLFEPREDFSRLHTYAIPWLDSVTCAMRAIASATLQAKHHRSGRTTAA